MFAKQNPTYGPPKDTTFKHKMCISNSSGWFSMSNSCFRHTYGRHLIGYIFPKDDDVRPNSIEYKLVEQRHIHGFFIVWIVCRSGTISLLSQQTHNLLFVFYVINKQYNVYSFLYSQKNCEKHLRIIDINYMAYE